MTIEKMMAQIISPSDFDQINWPLKKVVDGNPQATYYVVSKSNDSRNFSGVWECTPGRFEVNYTWDETIYVLEGLVSIEEDGTIRQFKSGDFVHFPIGLKCTWDVHRTIKKVYTLFSPEPLDL